MSSISKRTIARLAAFSGFVFLGACGAPESDEGLAQREQAASSIEANETGTEALISNASALRNYFTSPDAPEWFVPKAWKPTEEVLQMAVQTENGEEMLPYQMIDGQPVHGGDIILPTAGAQAQGGESGDISTQSFGKNYVGAKWEGGVIPYVIGRVPSRYNVQKAIEHWNTRTKMRLVPRTNQRSYVYFRSGSGCSSSIGRVGGAQYINLSSSCGTGNVIHEIGHAFGLWHEQARPDRDNYVRVNFNNILSGYSSQFNKQTSSSNMMASVYETNSIMHYGSTAFARRDRYGRYLYTIVRRNGTSFNAQRSYLTDYDIQGIHKIYGK